VGFFGQNPPVLSKTEERVSMKLSDAADVFLRHCRLERGLSKLTMTAYQLDLRQFRQKQSNDLVVAAIDKNLIREYLGWLDEQYKPRSIKRKLATLKSFFTFLEQEEYIEASPFRKLRLRLERAKSLPRTLSVSSVTKLLQCAYACRNEAPVASRAYQEATRDIAVLETLFSTGVRVSELCQLRAADVDLNHHHILVMGKGKRERGIPLCDKATVQALNSYKRLYAEFLEPESAFFRNRDKHPLSDQSVRQLIKKYQKLACIPENATPHMFRHTIATLLLENGVGIRNIQTLLGHSSLAVTEIYTHVSLSAQREALGKRHPRRGLKLEETHR